MDKFKIGDICVINNRTSTNNGKVVTVLKYPHKNWDKIVMVQLKSRKFLITESSLRLASKYDIIRNFTDKQLRRFLKSIK